MPSADWQRLRLLRSDPPAGVTDQGRLAVFSAALEQSEQLMRAAESVGTAVRPLLLFYSLSQAGRAIAAARLGEPWRLAGHGVSVLEGQDEVSNVFERVVYEADRQDDWARRRDRRSAFAGVTDAIGSAHLATQAQLGAAWTAIPELVEPATRLPTRRDWRRPLRIYLRPLSAYRADADVAPYGRPLMFLVDGLPDDERIGVNLIAELKEWPIPFDADALKVYNRYSPGGSFTDTRGTDGPDATAGRMPAENGELLPAFR
jgi:hypothetical protein